MAANEGKSLRPLADSRSSSDSTERPLRNAYLPPRRERRLRVVEPPAGASAPMGVNDPQRSATVLRTGHRNRLKPPLKLRDEAPRPSQIGCLQDEANIAPARSLLLWAAIGAEHDPAADLLPPPIPAFEFDQRLSW